MTARHDPGPARDIRAAGTVEATKSYSRTVRR